VCADSSRMQTSSSVTSRKPTTILDGQPRQSL
jgi:hypothetical protein